MKRLLLLAFFVVAAWVGWESCYVLGEGELAVVTTLGGEPRSVREAGLYPKAPFVSHVQRLQGRVQVKETKPQPVRSTGGHETLLSVLVSHRIVDPLTFLRVVGSEAALSTQFDDLVGRELEQLSGAPAFGPDALARIKAATATWGVEVIDVRPRRNELTPLERELATKRLENEYKSVAQRDRDEAEATARQLRTETDARIALLTTQAREDAEAIRREADAAGR